MHEGTKPISVVLVALCIIGLGLAPARLAASVVVSGKAIDAAATIDGYRAGMELDAFQVPWSGSEVTLHLVVGETTSSSSRKWNVPLDGEGKFSMDTGMASIPTDGRLVISALREGEQYFSPFFRNIQDETVNLYAISEDPADLRPNVTVEYAASGAGDSGTLRVKVELKLVNAGKTMFVGAKSGSPHREIFRVPIPVDGTVIDSSSPDPDSVGWRRSDDKLWMVIDTPIPGLLDLARQGMQAQESIPWSVTYETPGRQNLVQAFPIPFELKQAQFAVWCYNEDQSIESASLTSTETYARTDPITNRQRQFDVSYNQVKPLEAGKTVVVALTTDSLVLKQISRRAAKWVLGFALIVVLGIVLGLALGPKGTPPELLLEGLAGDQVLDRIADLDQRHEAGKISDTDYRRYRSSLVQLAAEELEVPQSPAAAGEAHGATSVGPQLTTEMQELAARIREIDSSGATDPSTITERAQLLEALYKNVRGAEEKDTTTG